MKRLSPGVRFLLGFVTFLLCVVLFVTSIAGILLANTVQILSSQENLEAILQEVLFVELQPTPSVLSAPMGGSPLPLNYAPYITYQSADIRLSEKQQSTTSVVEWIYNALADDFGDELTVDLETVKLFVAESTLDDFLVKKVAIMINDAYTGKQTVTLSPEEIRAAIEENAALIEQYFGVTMDDQVITDVTTIIEENEYISRIEEEGIVNIVMNPDKPSAEAPDSEDAPEINMNPNSVDPQQIVDAFRSIFSVQTLLLCIGACVVLIALILLVNMKQIWAGLKKTGWTLMLAALPFVLLTVATWVIPAGWAERWGIYSIIEVLVCQVLTINAVICFSIFSLGLVLMIVGIVVKKIARKKFRQESQLEAISEAVFEEAPVAVEFPAEEEAPAEEESEEAEETESEETEEIEEAEETEETV